MQVRSGPLLPVQNVEVHPTRSRTERHPATNRACGGSNPPGLASRDPVAQSAGASARRAEGRWFESTRDHFEGVPAPRAPAEGTLVHSCGEAQRKSGGLISRTVAGSSPATAIPCRAGRHAQRGQCSWPIRACGATNGPGSRRVDTRESAAPVRATRRIRHRSPTGRGSGLRHRSVQVRILPVALVRRR